MSIEKRGVVNEDTPSEKKSCCGGNCASRKTVQTKQAADGQEDHLMTRLSDQVAQDAKKR